jgi:hypothetical protein
MYIMTPEPISTACFLNPSHQSVCLYSYPPIVARQRLAKDVTAATATHATRIVERVVFYAVHVLSNESRRLGLPRTFVSGFRGLEQMQIGLCARISPTVPRLQTLFGGLS